MEARELQKAEETVADVTLNGSTEAEQCNRTEKYIDCDKIYHDYR